MAGSAPRGVTERQSVMKRAFDWYSEKLSTHPLLTKSLTGAIIAAAGDVMCQAGTYTPTKKDKEGTSIRTVTITASSNSSSSIGKWLESFWQEGWDYRRSLHFFILGFVFVAPTSHYWYGGMAKHAWTRGQSFKQISKRVVLDQFVWTPVFFVIWLGGFWSMEANEVNLSHLQEQLTTSLPDIMVANWILWIPAQYINFYACPVKFQVLFVNLIELGWNCYLSFAASGGGHGHSHNHNHSIVVADKEEIAVVTEVDEDDQRDTHRGGLVIM